MSHLINAFKLFVFFNELPVGNQLISLKKN